MGKKHPTGKVPAACRNTTDISRFTPDGRVTSEFLDGHLVYNRAVRTLETRKIVGYITFLYDDRVLKERLDVIAGNGDNFLGLYDSVDDVLICCDNIDKEDLPAGTGRSGLIGIAQGGITITVDGIGQMLLCSDEVMNDGWYFLSAVSNDDIYEMQSLLMLMILSFALIAVLLIFCVHRTEPYESSPGPSPISWMLSKKSRTRITTLPWTYTPEMKLKFWPIIVNITARRIDELVNQNLKANLAYEEMPIAQLQHQSRASTFYITRWSSHQRSVPDGPYRGSPHHHRRIRQADEKPYKRRNCCNR